MTPDDARPEADEVGHDPEHCTACQARHALQADYRRMLEDDAQAIQDMLAERFQRPLDWETLSGGAVPSPRTVVSLTPQTRAILQAALDRRSR